METDAEQKPKISLKTKANILAIASVTIVALWFVTVTNLWSNQKGEIGYFVRYSGRFCVIAAILCGVISLILSLQVVLSVLL